MTKRPLLLALAISALGLANSQSAEDKKDARSYKWVDSQGVTHYGDNVPPEYAGQGRSELNSQGVELRQFPRQLSPEEAAIAQKTAAEEARRRQHDSFLLMTYTKVADIERLRDERVALIDGQMDIARGSIDGSNQRLAELERRMRGFRPYSSSPSARRVPDQLVEQVARTLKEREALRNSMTLRESEKDGLRAQFDADIARYRELTNPNRAR